jgi:hypothetical protein
MSRLEDISIAFRNQNLVRNDYKANDQYTLGHPDTLSDGDELGKDEVNGSVGSLTDIKTRERNLVKNKFNKNNEYNAGNA